MALEDHGIRACYAALRMQEAVKRYAQEVQRTHGVPIQIRVGLNSGEALVRWHWQRYEQGLHGRGTNRASRRPDGAGGDAGVDPHYRLYPAPS